MLQSGTACDPIIPHYVQVFFVLTFFSPPHFPVYLVSVPAVSSVLATNHWKLMAEVISVRIIVKLNIEGENISRFYQQVSEPQGLSLLTHLLVIFLINAQKY